MATGLSNKLTGQIGEYMVCAELGRLGLIATSFTGNVSEFDLLVCDSGLKSLPIQEPNGVMSLPLGAKWGAKWGHVITFVVTNFRTRIESCRRLGGNKRGQTQNIKIKIMEP